MKQLEGRFAPPGLRLTGGRLRRPPAAPCTAAGPPSRIAAGGPDTVMQITEKFDGRRYS